jgi:hypothetical protein
MAPCHRIVAWVVADDGGIEWFVCGPHSRRSPTARWTSKTALAAWLDAHQLPPPDPPLRCPTVTDVVDDTGQG